MQLQILMMLITQMFALITPEVLRKFTNAGLDMLENVINKTETEYDNAVILPIIEMIRLTLGIPDGADQIAINNTVGASLDVKTKGIATLLLNLFNMIPKELMKSFIDAGFDKVEDIVKATTNQIDDTVVLPVINLIRKSFDIPEDAEHLAIMTTPAVVIAQ